MQKLTMYFFTSVILAGATAYAADEFTAVDTNGDGGLTIDEVQAAMPNVGVGAFVQADQNADGILSEDEFLTAMNEGVLTSG